MQQDAKNILIEYIKDNETKIYRIAYSYVLQRDAALDILQEAIIKALENIDKLRVKEYVKTWFYRILINEALMYIKKNKKYVQMEYEGQEISEDFEDTCTSNIEVYKNIQMLDKKLKTVIILRYFENLKLEEISRITKTNLSTVKSRLYKGLEIMKSNMKGDK